jgi:hypothetical protein
MCDEDGDVYYAHPKSGVATYDDPRLVTNPKPSMTLQVAGVPWRVASLDSPRYLNMDKKKENLYDPNVVPAEVCNSVYNRCVAIP